MGSIPSSKDLLLPAALDNRVRNNPQGMWAKFPVSDTTYELGLHVATNQQVANAVNRVAWTLEETLGRGQNFETIAYIGPNDPRCYVVLLAAVKVGYKAFFPSPRNSKIAHINLLERLHCKTLITTTPEPPCVPQILEDYSMQQIYLPGLLELLQSENIPCYPYEKSFSEAQNDPIFVLHTSGSTGKHFNTESSLKEISIDLLLIGIPKPLVYTNEFTTRFANAMSLPAPEGHISLNEKYKSGSFFTLLPAFHVAGVGFALIVPLFSESIPVFPLPAKPPTTEGFLEAVKYTEFDWAFLLPVILDELSRDPAALEMVSSKLQYLYYTGGSLPQTAGETLAEKIPVYQCMGSSEKAGLPLIQPADNSVKDSWRYIQVHPSIHAEFRHRFEDLHELVIAKNDMFERYQPVFAHFPHLAEYETRDLFSAHPTRPDLWRHRGRIDDIVVFINGEKTNPISFEQEVSRHPEVRSALVAGDQRFEACLLVELHSPGPHSPEEQSQIIERIWPAVKKANAQCPAHARVSKARIMFSDPAMPMPRAGKGTVQRQCTLNLYADLIDKLYATTGDGPSKVDIESIGLSNPVAVTKIVRMLVLDLTEWTEFKDDDDFFALGMDSLQVLQLSRELKALGLANAAPSTIYSSPSVELLVESILHSSQGSVSNRYLEHKRLQVMASTLQRYESEIDNISETVGKAEPRVNTPESEVIILTGSTGAVGSHILYELLQNKTVSHVYCLNRGNDSRVVQESRNAERGIPASFSPAQVTFLAVDLSKPSFGLETAAYEKILSTTTQIIHNAWPVNFNQRLQSFQPSLDGVLNLISFAAHAKLSPSLFFLSSISAVTNYHQVPDAASQVPETAVTSLECPGHMGYGESKYLTERMLDHASTKLNIKTGVARVGQVAGTAHNPRGWNQHEWFPSLVVSSRALRALPLSLGSFEDVSCSGGLMDSVDWVPIDQLATVLVELSGKVSLLSTQPANTGVRVFHPLNPHPRQWNSLAPVVARTVQATLAAARNGDSTVPEIRLVKYSEWLELLRASAAGLETAGKEQTLREVPASKLLEFFEESLVVKGADQSPRQLAITQALEASPSLRSLEAIRDEWVEGWVQGWLL
ncbi:NRPS-like enzyme [Penicillium alfredii]|uniref:NRPS-like enzyme n=1 Tax=Penicillium alfredii TaxID=1506179 RepID=A0A9W9F1M5_9EURO|nr:NRPS-like enzyme [Penicillium alfredii]KAJ5091912.1 NRPS-like enzyme [Penicillium alfredii]